MAETQQQYRARLDSYVEGRDPVSVQAETAGILESLIQGVAEHRLSTPPAPGKWPVNTILAHLAEGEIAGSWRYRQMLEHPGTTLMPYDQELWARLSDYGSWSAQESLNLFRGLREANLKMLARLSPQEWERHGVHAERGPMTVADLARQIAGHDVNHIKQIREILAV